MVRRLNELGGLHTPRGFRRDRGRLCDADRDRLSRPSTSIEMPPNGQGLDGAADAERPVGLQARRPRSATAPSACIWRSRPDGWPIGTATASSATRTRPRAGAAAAVRRLCRPAARRDPPRPARMTHLPRLELAGHATRSISRSSTATATRSPSSTRSIYSFGSGVVGAEDRRRAAEPRLELPPRPGAPERDRARQAADAHDHAWHGDEERPRGDAVRRHGRRLPAVRPCPSPDQHARLRHGPAAGAGCAACVLQ